MINGVFQKNKELQLSVAKKEFHCTAILLWEITTELKDNTCTDTILSQNFRAPVLTDHFPEGFCFQVGCRFWANDIRLFKGISSLNKLFLRLNFRLTLYALISLVFIFCLVIRDM